VSNSDPDLSSALAKVQESLAKSTASTALQGSRRGFLRGVAASGLATAIAWFGGGLTAEAANWYCCTLAVSPPNMDYGYCSLHGEYDWYCTDGTWQCYCCEYYAAGSSAASCSLCC
jgi:hypothetical protein